MNKILSENLKEIVTILTNKKQKVATMESCTGGALANAITNIPGASEVFNFGAVTYSNEYKIKFKVDASVINKYSVYSIQTANEMSKAICQFTGSDYGIGITGKLKKVDTNNNFGEDDIVFVSIYEKSTSTFYNEKIKVIYEKREENKDLVLGKVAKMLLKILSNE